MNKNDRQAAIEAVIRDADQAKTKYQLQRNQLARKLAFLRSGVDIGSKFRSDLGEVLTITDVNPDTFRVTGEIVTACDVIEHRWVPFEEGEETINDA